jgi:16S rRNA (cytosine1402-N4)-methyltransferase
MMTAPHVPVLLAETLHYLQPGPGKRIVDGTYGYGGHAAACLERGADVLGLDLDADAVAACRKAMRAQPRLFCCKVSFRCLDAALQEVGWIACEGVLLDLGVNSHQLDDPSKGFTYRTDAPLDLRFDREKGTTAAELLQRLDEAKLADLLWEYGEERSSRRLARAIRQAQARQAIRTTAQLRAVVEAARPTGASLMPLLSRVFQALRIAVNDELGALAEALELIPQSLAPGGRVVVVSYHSLEDRLVKRWIDRESRDCICPRETPECRCGHHRSLRSLTRKAVAVGGAEAARNPRARSARLRCAEKIDPPGGKRS